MSAHKELERFGMFNCDGDCKHCDNPLNCSLYTGADDLRGRKVDVIIAKQLKDVGYEFKQYMGNVEYVAYDVTDADNSKLTLQLSLTTETKEADFVYLTISEATGTKAIIVVRENERFCYPIPVIEQLYKVFDNFNDKEVFKLFSSLHDYMEYTESIGNLNLTGLLRKNRDTHSNLNEYYKFNKESDMEDTSMADFKKEAEVNKDNTTRFGGGEPFRSASYDDCLCDGCDGCDCDDYDNDEETYSSEVVGVAFLLGVVTTLGTIGIAKAIKFLRKK